VTSASHASAVSLQVRVERDDLERPDRLDRLARALGIPPAEAKARYAEAVAAATS
jgi:hypothetical protein